MSTLPSNEAVWAAYQEYVQGSMDSTLAIAYAIDMPRIVAESEAKRTDEIVAALRSTGGELVMVGRDLSNQIVYGPSSMMTTADWIARKFADQ